MAQQPEATQNWHDEDYRPHTGPTPNAAPRAPYDEVAPKVGDAQALASWGAHGCPAPGPSAS